MISAGDSCGVLLVRKRLSLCASDFTSRFRSDDGNGAQRTLKRGSSRLRSSALPNGLPSNHCQSGRVWTWSVSSPAVSRPASQPLARDAGVPTGPRGSPPGGRRERATEPRRSRYRSMMSTRFERARLLTTSAEADAALVDSSYRWRTATGGRTSRSGSDDAIRRSRSCVRGEFLRVASDQVLALNSRRTGIRWTRGDGCWAHNVAELPRPIG